jgi:glycosyltransferase involved in cell wall biosynthesis
MKLAFLSQPLDNVLPPSQNSIGIWIYEVARRLAKNHQITVFANGGRIPPKTRVIEGVTYKFFRAVPYRITRDVSTRLSRYTSPEKPPFASWLYAFEYGLQAALAIRKQGIEVVHIVNFSQFIPIVRAFNPQAKIVIHMQCEWLSQLDRATIASRISKANLVLGCSEYITQLIRDRFPQFAPICRTVYNGVNENNFYPAEKDSKARPPRLLFVSRLSPEKGVHILLRAFRKVVERYPTAEIELIGSPSSAPVEYIIRLTHDEKIARLLAFYKGDDYYDHLVAEIPAELKDQVIFSGHVKHDRVPDHYRKADILINPSLSEPFGMALVEGMASGIPVIAPRVGGMVEIIEHGATGYLVNVDDVQDLADTILHLLDEPETRAAMGQTGRQRVMELFTWDRIVDQLLAQYQVLFAGENISVPLPSKPFSDNPTA